MDDGVIQWLIEGDASIQYQAFRDLRNEDRADLQLRIPHVGWGKLYMDCQMENGHWGKSFYQPKWTSTHYTLMDLRNLEMPPEVQSIREVISKIAKEERGQDGGIHPAGSVNLSDVCINGMFLNYASYFKSEPSDLQPAVDFILSQKMADGGFNCRLNRSGAVHSSLHTTLCVMEGICAYLSRQYLYRIQELSRSLETCVEFLLQHRLYQSDRSGEIIHPAFLRLAFPGRWRYDILRALDCLRFAGFPKDARMNPALDQVEKRRRKDGRWTCSKHPGQTHFEMESGRQPSRWNTLRALRVLNFYGR